MLGKKGVKTGSLFHWKEFLHYLQEKERYDYIPVLKMALEIYSGEYKGLAGVAEEKEMREQEMHEHLKAMIRQSVESIVKSYRDSGSGYFSVDKKGGIEGSSAKSSSSST